jgi:hypothetical protein
MIDLLIVTAPFTYTFGPSLSPAVLKSCCVNQGINTKAWDLSADFNFSHKQHPYYENIVAWMQNPELQISQEEFSWYTNIIQQYVLNIVENYQPKSVAISLLTFNSQRFTEDLCYYLRIKNSEIKIIIGGPGIDVFQHEYQKKWHELMLDTEMADTAIIGEGEYTLPNVVINDLYGVVVSPQLSNAELNLIPIPDYNDYNFKIYKQSTKSYWQLSNNVHSSEQDTLSFLINASRGCVKNCNFCDVGRIWPKFRFRSGESVANEILFLHHQYNARYFSFTDSLMNGGLKPYYEMNQILAERLPKTIKYDGQIICRSQQDMPEKYFEAMSLAGCYFVSIGMESGSQQVRMHMGKGSSQEDIYYTTEMLTKYNIAQSWNIIAGYPTETDEDWEATMNLIKYWINKTNGLLTITPIDTFLLLDDTPMLEKNTVDTLKLSRNTINGYSSFAWTTQINAGNTYDVRAARFIELCNWLLEYDVEKYRSLNNRIKLVLKRLDWYNDENKTKKIFSVTAY